MPVKQCFICLESRIIFQEGPCGHNEFCTECVSKVTKTGAKCPLCRAHFPPYQKDYRFFSVCTNKEIDEIINGQECLVDKTTMECVMDYATKIGDLELAKIMINHDENLRITTNSNLLAPHAMAIIHGHIDVMRFCIDPLFKEKGPSILNPWNNGPLALNLAVQHHQTEIATILIEEYGQDIEASDMNGIDAHMMAAAFGNIEFLEKYPPKDINYARDTGTMLHQACLQGELESVKWLFSKGADPNENPKYGPTCMHLAVYSKSLAIIALLLKHGSRLDISWDAHLPFHLALNLLHHNPGAIRSLMPIGWTLQDLIENPFVTIEELLEADLSTIRMHMKYADTEEDSQAVSSESADEEQSEDGVTEIVVLEIAFPVEEGSNQLAVDDTSVEIHIELDDGAFVQNGSLSIEEQPSINIESELTEINELVISMQAQLDELNDEL